MGDLFFHKVVPFIDVKSGGSPAGYLKALDAVIARAPADVTVIPGHGEVTNLDGLRGMRQYVSDLIAAARKARAAGRTKEQCLAEVDLPAYREYQGWGDRFKANAAAAWDELGS
jgi:glyoxylase-like metal-dependent hydrolase (beta-lactamase superfamily II)